jgi:hypothetical protein
VTRWAPIALCALLGCEAAPVDLGSNAVADAGGGGGAGGTAPAPVVTSDCPSATEAELEALRGSPCDSTCAMTGGTPRDVAGAVELVAVTAGRWRTCAGPVPWAADVVGIEMQAGCTLFLLHDAPDGGVSRSVLPEEQGTFNVVSTTLGGATTRALDLFFPGWTWRVEVTTSDCPHRMSWTRDGGAGPAFAGIPSPSPPLQ